MSTCCFGFAESSVVGVPGAPGFGTFCTVASAGTITSTPRFSWDWCWRIGQALTVASRTCTRVLGDRDDRPAQLERERRPARRREEQVRRPLQPRVGVDRGAASRVELEVQVGVQPVRVTRVADEPDRLAGHHLRAVLEALRVGGPGDALAAVVVLRGQVVVEVDVVVVRAARAVEIEHAAGARGALPELDLARLDGEREAPLGRHDVDPLVRPARPRLAEVVAVGDRAEHREDELLRHGGARAAREGQERKSENKGSSGCRPVADHGLAGRSEGPDPTSRPR